MEEWKKKEKVSVVIDIGSSSARVFLIDRSGTIRKKCQAGYPVYTPDELTALQKPEEIMGKIWQMLREAGQWLTEQQMEAEAVSVTAQRSSVIPVDQNGNALSDAVSWHDRRSEPVCRSYEKEWEHIYRITGMKLSPVFSAPKMIWLKENEPELYQRADKLIGFQEYVLYQLTNKFATDLSIASRTSLLDIEKLAWSPQLLAMFGLDERKLCPLVSVGSIVGTAVPAVMGCLNQTGSIPVISAGGDQQCAALGLGCLEHGDIEVTSGTGAYVVGISDVPAWDPSMSVNCNVSAIPGKWIVEGAVLSAGKAAAWLNKQLFPESGDDFTEFMKALRESAPGANGVVASVAFAGKGTPMWEPRVRAGFMGIGFENTKGDLVRALLEGIAAELRECTKAVEDTIGKSSADIRVSGGMTKNPVYCQMLADMLKKEIHRPKECEATGLGAWISAQAALGNVKSFRDAYSRYADKNTESCYEPDGHTEPLYRKADQMRMYYESYYGKEQTYE